MRISVSCGFRAEDELRARTSKANRCSWFQITPLMNKDTLGNPEIASATTTCSLVSINSLQSIQNLTVGMETAGMSDFSMRYNTLESFPARLRSIETFLVYCEDILKRYSSYFEKENVLNLSIGA